ncbi:hypothetical protein BGZ54_008120 [Gamsiella multidivaricata]|nr:hypothetical protein BGZ54_008120 [Gamsiella multidivaricata]
MLPADTPINALDLPEIRGLLRTHLSIQDLLQCILVNRVWNASFLPAIWAEVTLTPTSFAGRSTPDIESMERHSHLIQHLVLQDMLGHTQQPPPCPNLQTLHISMTFRARAESCQDIKESLTLVLQRYPSIQYLGLMRACPDWETVAELKYLKQLELVKLDANAASMSGFWRMCMRLEALSLTCINIPNLTQLQDQTTFETLKSLKIHHLETLPSAGQVEMVLRCPNLKILHMQANTSDQGRRTTTQSIYLSFADNWSKLWLRYHDYPKISDEDEARILKHLRHCVDWGVVGTGFGPCSFQALQDHHFATIERLDLTGCLSVTSAMAQLVLTSCPLLKKFQAIRIYAQDIVTDRHWVCTALDTLCVFIDFEPLQEEATTRTDDVDSDTALQKQVFEQLSFLHSLKILYIGCQLEDVPLRSGTRRGLDFRLCKGLDLMRSLRKLNLIDFGRVTQKMGLDEVEWIAEHWKCLKEIHGIANEQETMRQTLKRRLQKNGIELYSF